MPPCAWASARALQRPFKPFEMFVCPVSGSVLASLLGDEEVEASFSCSRMLAHLLAFERALTRSLADAGLITDAACGAILKSLEGFAPDPDRLREGTLRDGVAVPELVRAIRSILPDEHRGSFHFGATSQDLIDTSLALALKEVNTALEFRTAGIQSALERLNSLHGARRVMGRTRMQNALAISFSDRVSGWGRQFGLHSQRLGEIRGEVEILQLGGPVGNRSGLGDRASGVAAGMAEQLGLSEPGAAWHSQRGGLVNYASWLATLCGILGKFGQDCALMAQMGELSLKGAGGSSAMKHKSNPVAAETLVTLARFSATLIGGMQHAAVHEQERSGSAWTLEWLLLPQICVAAGASLRTALRLLQSIQSVGSS